MWSGVVRRGINEQNASPFRQINDSVCATQTNIARYTSRLYSRLSLISHLLKRKIMSRRYLERSWGNLLLNGPAYDAMVQVFMCGQNKIKREKKQKENENKKAKIQAVVLECTKRFGQAIVVERVMVQSATSALCCAVYVVMIFCCFVRSKIDKLHTH